jgi:eukaryotic-like serine/threonine-protein kinase
MFVDVTDLPADPLAGTRYRFVGVIGRGGSSDVYEATGPKGDRFAIKVLRAAYRDAQQYATRLLQEGRLLASISHANLVPVREMGMTRDGRPFLAMPRLIGQPLRDYLVKCGPIEPNVAAKLLAGALDGLHEAHCRGIVHRDVKPGNIFVLTKDDGGPERALMFDFGIAKVTGAAAHHTTGDCILGTPRYLAPEQIMGGRINGRVDVYAMGIVLFETIAARGPYDILRGADFDAQMRAHLALAPRRLDDLSPASPALARVIARALEKAPGKRYATAAVFAEALRRAVSVNTRRESRIVLEGGLS